MWRRACHFKNDIDEPGAPVEQQGERQAYEVRTDHGQDGEDQGVLYGVSHIAVLKEPEVIIEADEGLLRTHAIPFVEGKGESAEKGIDHKSQKKNQSRHDECEFLKTPDCFMR